MLLDRFYSPGRNSKRRYCKEWQAYVDDLTITASGFSEEALAAVSRGADFFVDMFEKGLRLTVSLQKSFAVASRPRLAARLRELSEMPD